VWNIKPPPGLEYRTVHFVASCYTDEAIPATTRNVVPVKGIQHRDWVVGLERYFWLLLPAIYRHFHPKVSLRVLFRKYFLLDL